jgi:hypothetical protein
MPDPNPATQCASTFSASYCTAFLYLTSQDSVTGQAHRIDLPRLIQPNAVNITLLNIEREVDYLQQCALND